MAVPPLHAKSIEERIKSRVGLLNALGLGLFAAGVINPAIATTAEIMPATRFAAAILAALLIMAGQRYLRYIPNPSRAEEPSNV